MPSESLITEASQAGSTQAYQQELKAATSVVAAQFEVAILNAIPRELAAMDKVFGPLGRIPVDRGMRSYEVATVVKANGTAIPVVIAGVTTAGTVQTATVVASLAQQLPYLKTVLLVGIAAGQPSLSDEERDIWLGDVVVGNALVQYDHVKRISADNIECRGTSLPVPNPQLLRAASRLKSQMEGNPGGPWSWERIAEASAASWPHAARPKVNADPNRSLREYQHSLHRHAADRPHLHIGKIGSANTLLKDKDFRNGLSASYSTLAYEMEGAGLALASSESNLQHLIVRGICDYADENKDDVWQRYAALVAASVAKALLIDL